MSNLAFRMKLAKQRGERIVREFGFDTLPIDPKAVAARRDIRVEAKPNSEPGVSGMLLRHGETIGILYATHIESEGFQNFSIAHELGHYFLDGHIDQVLPEDGLHTSHADFVSSDPYEMEADSFAAGLLMPTTMFRRVLGKQKPGLAAVEALADLCRTSLTSTAIRYAELSEDAVAVIVSSDRTVNFCFLSETMKTLQGITWLRKGSPVPPDTETARFNMKRTRTARRERTEADIDIMDWLGGNRSLQTVEEVKGLGNSGRTLTVLHCPTLVDESYRDEEDDEEERLEESWTPRFRR